MNNFFDMFFLLDQFPQVVTLDGSVRLLSLVRSRLRRSPGVVALWCFLPSCCDLLGVLFAFYTDFIWLCYNLPFDGLRSVCWRAMAYSRCAVCPEFIQMEHAGCTFSAAFLPGIRAQL